MAACQECIYSLWRLPRLLSIVCKILWQISTQSYFELLLRISHPTVSKSYGTQRTLNSKENSKDNSRLYRDFLRYSDISHRNLQHVSSWDYRRFSCCWLRKLFYCCSCCCSCGCCAIKIRILYVWNSWVASPLDGLYLPAVLTWSSSSSSGREIDSSSDSDDKCQMFRWETGILLFAGLPPLLDSLLCVKLCGFRRIFA